MTKTLARVSARTEKMDFTQEYGTKYAISTWLRDEQVRIAMRKVPGRLQPSTELFTEPIAVVGFGPSLKQTWEEIRAFRYVMTCSGAHRFLIDRGIIPTWHTAVDPLPKNTPALIGPPHTDVEYLMSSTCHPDVWEHLKGCRLKLWHVFTHEEEANRILPPGEWAITGGADIGLRSLVLARLLGFTTIHVFGIDGCAGPAKESHAGPHPGSPSLTFPCEFPTGSGLFYNTTPAMLSCAKSFPHEVDQIKDATVTFHGEGLVQAIMANHVPKKPKEANLAFVKPDLISSKYRVLNTQLHESNPAYGTSGVKRVELVMKLAKGLKTESILDYGCGKGLLAKGMPFPIWEYDPAVPGKDEAPRPADLVVCTDVLEHVEPDCLVAVLTDLRRVTKTVGYFTVHTGPSQKTLADGRNTHLIQKGEAWWRKTLSKFFTIGSLTPRGPELEIIVGPLVPDAKKDLTTVEHDGTKAVFYTPNDTTKWRAKTLFTKEPITITWLDSLRPGDVLWDVGANMGGYSVWAGVRRGVEVYAFEPEADTYAVLCRNLRENRIKGLAYCVAVTDQPVLSTLFCSQAEAGSSCHTFGKEVGPDLQSRTGIKQGAVGMTLDHLTGLLPLPTHLKIDVDGLEHLVIAGGKRLLQNTALKSILVEVNAHLPEHQVMIQQLQTWGYQFDPAQVTASRRKDGPFEGCAEYLFTPTSAAEWWTLEAIKETPLTTEPFPHCIVQNIFPPDVYEELVKTLPSDTEYVSLELSRGTKGYPQRFTHSAPVLVDWMRAGRLRAALDQKFGMQSASDETLLLRDHPGYTIAPHTDTPSKVVTMLIFLGNSRHGTSLYRPRKQGFTDSKGFHHPRAKFAEACRVPGTPNTALIFARTDNSFHGTEPFRGPGVRDILLYDTRRAS